ncbi:hypothetical protein [Bacillus cereus]|uniref:hypothetical protein n=1 Tax=Bacillus cereus TaxID=1396 RepID=UPI00124D728F|nr:hypothetical protein [Bacillus cereus]KAB2397325.1 hypothetical protein F8171_06570 [Bacillus cereus]
MSSPSILLLLAAISKVEVLKHLFFSLSGLTITSAYSLYIALCPTLNTGCAITLPVIWKYARFQLFGAIAIAFGWFTFGVSIIFGFKAAFVITIFFSLFLALHFALQKLAGYVKRKISKENDNLNI